MQTTQAYNATTTGLIDRMFQELDLLHAKKITPARARASAALGTVIVETSQLEITHHRLRPRRNGRVLPVRLGTNVVDGEVVSSTYSPMRKLAHKKPSKR